MVIKASAESKVRTYFFLSDFESIIATDTPETESMGFEIFPCQVFFAVFHTFSKLPWLVENDIGI